MNATRALLESKKCAAIRQKKREFTREINKHLLFTDHDDICIRIQDTR